MEQPASGPLRPPGIHRRHRQRRVPFQAHPHMVHSRRVGRTVRRSSRWRCGMDRWGSSRRIPFAR
jgi:hypothetical protein